MILESASSTLPISATSGPGFIAAEVPKINNEVEPIIDIPNIERVTEIDDTSIPPIDTTLVNPADIEDTIVCDFSSQLPTATAHTTISIYELNTYQEALSSPDSLQWILAMQEELQSMEEQEVWTVVPIPNRNIVGSK